MPLDVEGGDTIYVYASLCVVHPWSESKTRKQVHFINIYIYNYLYGHAGTVASSVRRPANRRALRSPNAPNLPEGAKWTRARSSTLLHATSRCWWVLVCAGSNLLYEFPTRRESNTLWVNQHPPVAGVKLQGDGCPFPFFLKPYGAKVELGQRKRSVS